MVLYVLVAVITVLLGLLVNNRRIVRGNMVSRQQILNGLCLVSVFLLLFAVSACRLNVGNDYAKYVEFMHLVHCDAFVPTECGFNWIVKVIYGLSGFENYLLVFAFFAFFTINTYGSDLITLVFLKKKLTPESFAVFKKDISLKKDLKDKILMSYALSHDIKYMIKSLEEEYDEVQEELKNLKDIERNFIPHNETAEII